MATDLTFEDELEAIGFVAGGASRRGGRMWQLDFNRFLTFSLHDYGDDVVLTWTFLFGDFALERGWQVGAGETTFQELYPQRDVRLSVDVAAIRAEITRVLGTLRLDLGDPTL